MAVLVVDFPRTRRREDFVGFGYVDKFLFGLFISSTTAATLAQITYKLDEKKGVREQLTDSCQDGTFYSTSYRRV